MFCFSAGTNEWKFKCSQCDAVFKTPKTQLLHMKNKHSQEKVMESQSSIASVAQPGLIITQTTAGQPQTAEAVVPIPQQIDVLDAEQIKRLIEKFENVKKVNQLVILPFQTQGAGLPHPQGLMQPLHLDFTESTVQPSECREMDTDPSSKIQEQNKHQTSTEMEDVQEKETADLSQEEKINTLSENSDSRFDTEMTPAVLTEEQTQMDVIHIELIPVEPETETVLLDQTPLQVQPSQNDSVSQTADLEQLLGTQDDATLETTTETTSVALVETETSLNVEEVNALITNDITVSEEVVTKTDTLCSEQIQDVKDLESDSKVMCGQSDTVQISEPQEPKQNQDLPEQVDSEKEPSAVEPQSLTEQRPLNNLPNDTTGLQPKPRKKKQKVMTKPNKSKQNHQQRIEQDKDKDMYFKQKVQQDKKAKGVEGKSEVKTTCQTNSVGNKVSAVPQATQTKPQKRKMKSQNNLIKKAKTVQEPQQDQTLAPVQKKKKQNRTSQEGGPKKSKVRKPKSNDFPIKVKKSQTSDFQHKVKKTQKNDFQIKVTKPQTTDFQKNVHKIPKHKAAKRKRTPVAPDQAQIEQQALLLLKGHKQPQLKVHKLDATELEKSPPNKYDRKEPLSKSPNVTQPKKTKSTGNKMLCGEPLSPVDSSLTSASSAAKPKIVRKRKAPTKIDQEIALSPPYSRLTLGCQDCGKTFSEVSALQEHMASFHSAENMAQQDEAVDMTKESDTRPSEKHIEHNVFEIQVATDWEIGEILGDREEQRLSFPVLSPSPSLMIPSGCVEGRDQEDKAVEGTVSGPEHLPENNPEEFPVVGENIVPQEITENTEASDNLLDEEASRATGIVTETSGSEVKDAAEEEIKEELSLEVNLVMVGDQNEENPSPQINNLSSASQEHETEELSNSHPCSQPEQTEKEAEVVLTENVVHCVTEPEVKQEEEEVLVHKVDEQKRVTGRSSETRGRKGVGRGQGKRLGGKRSSRLNRSKKDMDAKKDSQDCQVVYQLCVLGNTPEEQDKETDKNGGNTTQTCMLSPPEESPEDQVVFELDSVTTSVTEVINSQDGSFIEQSTELARDDRSPGIILEKFLTACERNVEHPNSRSQRKRVTACCVHSN